MKLGTAVLLAALAAVVGVTRAEAGRPGRDARTSRWVDKVREDLRKDRDSSSVTVIGRAGDGEEPVKWMTNLDEAAKLAVDEDRPMLILFTTRDLEAANGSCRFAPNSLRRAVRETGLVPVKVMPPVELTTANLSPEETEKRVRQYKEAYDRYLELLRDYGARKGPCLVFTAPDKAKLNLLEAPSDDEIAVAIGRLDDMLDAYARLAGDGAGKAPAVDGKGSKAAGPDPGAEKPAAGGPPPAKEPAKTGGGEDDF
jgi:hypothetical protein